VKKAFRGLVSVVLAVIILLACLPLAAKAESAVDFAAADTFVAGGGFSMAVKADGTLWAWAWDGNDAGKPQTANKKPPSKTTPVKIMDNVKTVYSNNYECYAIKNDGTLWLIETILLSPVRFEVPVKVADNVKSVSFADGNTFMIKTDDSFWGWGYNEDGRLGIGTTEYQESPVKIIDDVVSVAHGIGPGYGSSAVSTFVIKADGTLWAWGKNGFGRIGNGSMTDVYSPVKIMDDVISVSAGNARIAAIKTDGTLWTWGFSWIQREGYVFTGYWIGSLGGASGASGSESIGRPTYGASLPVKLADDVRFVDSEHHVCYYIKNDKILWYWGGGGVLSKAEEPVKFLDNVIYVNGTSSGLRGFAIKSDNTLWAWGDSLYENNSELFDPTKIADNVLAVSEYSSPSSHFLFLKTDASLWGAGHHLRGEYQPGADSTPVKIMDGVKLPSQKQPPAMPGNTITLNGKTDAAWNIATLSEQIELDGGYIKAFDKDGFEIKGSYVGTGAIMGLYDSEDKKIESYALVVKGDVEGDGLISSSDARAVLRIVARIDTPNKPQNLAADVNGDGFVDAADARLILRYVAKLIDKF